MSDKLLTRRQVMALFGSGLGAAIVADTQAASNVDDGNVYGGTNAMAQAYKVGEGTWKGPLSARSEVPQENGNDFIQTDAGSNNDKFAFYHYNDGWSKQGWDVTSLSSERLANVSEFISPDMTAADVQAAIDEVHDGGGGTIVWERGEFRYSQNTTVGGEPAAIELKSNIEYLGRGYGTHIIQDEKDINVFATDYDESATDNDTASKVENIRIANMRLDGNKDAFSDFATTQTNNTLWLPLAKNTTVENVWSHDVHQHGIHPDAVIDSTIRNCRIWNVDGEGIHAATRTLDDDVVYGPQNTTMSECVLWNIAGNGISTGGDEHYGCSITDNHILDAGSNGIAVAGYSHSVKGNTVRDATDAGVFLNQRRVAWSGDEYKPSYGITVSGNAVEGEDTTTSGVRVDEVYDCTVSDSTVRNTTHGIELVAPAKDLTVTGGSISGAGGRGIYIRDGVNVDVSSTTIDGALYGFEVLTAASNVTISNVHAKNQTSSYGSMVRPDDIVVRDCTFTDSDSDGITVEGDDCLVAGCTAKNNGRHGIRIDGTDCNVRDPKGSGNSGDFIRDNGTRVRVDGVIGGGVLGGVDLGSTTGQKDGDRALADGTTGTAWLEATWDGSGWVQSDGTTV